MSIKALVPGVGTPFDQLAVLLQTPVVGPIQHVPPEGQVELVRAPTARDRGRLVQPVLLTRW